MKSSFSQIYIHLVFGTKDRWKLPNCQKREQLCSYMAGIIQHHKCRLYIGKVMPDHVHLLIGLHPTISVAEIAQTVKANSSRHINEGSWVPGKFSWCEGYGAFSISESVVPAVIRYIQNQESHHQTSGFGSEYKAMLSKSKVAESDMQNYWMVVDEEAEED
jgi:REP element-mobilizing transposase RayT